MGTSAGADEDVGASHYLSYGYVQWIDATIMVLLTSLTTHWVSPLGRSDDNFAWLYFRFRRVSPWNSSKEECWHNSTIYGNFTIIDCNWVNHVCIEIWLSTRDCHLVCRLVRAALSIGKSARQKVKAVYPIGRVLDWRRTLIFGPDCCQSATQ